MFLFFQARNMCEYFKFETWNPTYGYHYNINNAQNVLYTQNKLQQGTKKGNFNIVSFPWIMKQKYSKSTLKKFVFFYWKMGALYFGVGKSVINFPKIFWNDGTMITWYNVFTFSLKTLMARKLNKWDKFCVIT